MDQNFNNSQNSFLWTLLANPANDAYLYAYNLQRLVNDFPQSGILQAMLAHASDEKNLKQASVYFNPRSLYKLINAPSSFIGVADEKMFIQPGLNGNGHYKPNGYVPAIEEPFISQQKDEEHTEHDHHSSDIQAIQTIDEFPSQTQFDDQEVIHHREHNDVNAHQLSDTFHEADHNTETFQTHESEAEHTPLLPAAEHTDIAAFEKEIQADVTETSHFDQHFIPDAKLNHNENWTAENLLNESVDAIQEQYAEPTFNEPTKEAEVTEDKLASAPEVPAINNNELTAEHVINEVSAVEDHKPFEEIETAANSIVEEPMHIAAPVAEKPAHVATPVAEEPAHVATPVAVEPMHVAAPIAEESTHVATPVAEEQLIINSIAEADYFTFDKTFIEHEPAVSVENIEPAFSESSISQPEAETKIDEEYEQQDVSKYHDEKMPYTFMWWLDKTRKQHASVYQPYVKSMAVEPIEESKPKTSTDELQQQYYENIFHITSMEELDKSTAPYAASARFDPKRKEQIIVDRFIKEEPQIRPQSSDKLDNENKAKKSSEDRDELVSETLAGIYSDQMLYHKAIASYKKLMLKLPEKSHYFAEKIEQLEKKTN